MGGRAGEELLLDGEFTQGPSSDLERATQLATVMVTRYGMTHRGLAVRSGEPDVGSQDVIEELLGGALGDARSLLQDHQPLFMAIVNQLLEHETLEESELAELETSLSEEDRGRLPVGTRTMQVLHQAGQAASAVGNAVGSVVGTAVSIAGRTVLRPTITPRRTRVSQTDDEDTTTVEVTNEVPKKDPKPPRDGSGGIAGRQPKDKTKVKAPKTPRRRRGRGLGEPVKGF
jgi:hypothetical protein